MSLYQMAEGRPNPLGPTPRDGGVNFAVFSAHATVVEICLCDATGAEVQRLALPDREGDIWFGFIPDLPVGTRYGLRAHGPYAPEAGHRFNPAKFLVDPYAKALSGDLLWSDALMGHGPDGGPSPHDSAPYMPRSVVTAPLALLPDMPVPKPWSETIIYEAHVKGLSMQMPAVSDPGTFRALASPPVIEHLTSLGITATELLPVQSFIADAFLQSKGLPNYWGYQTLNFFAPHAPYLATGQRSEVQIAVTRLREAGIEVILDIVFNHSCEGDAHGPTLSFRGLDNASYYRLDAQGGYINDMGTGNSLNLNHPAMLRLAMDAMRHWVEAYGVSGFRFDLGAALGRTETGFHRHAPLLQAITQDPVLSGVKLIAEPWDIGPGGYQLGHFPSPFSEWNDRFRDTTRRAWRKDRGHVPELAARLMGSADLFEPTHRPPQASVNFVTAHDGFTLADLTLYSHRHNAANGEDGRDGHGENISENFGIEGPSDSVEIQQTRALRRRNLMATLLLSQGVPMLLAGDEIGNSQTGNNNAYAMDNPTGWVDWSDPDEALLSFTKSLIALRKSLPLLRQRHFLHGELLENCQRNLIWRGPNGAEMAPADWEAADLTCLIAQLSDGTQHALIVLETGDGLREITLPAGIWQKVLDTADPDMRPKDVTETHTLTGPCAAVFLASPC